MHKCALEIKKSDIRFCDIVIKKVPLVTTSTGAFGS